MAVLLAQAHPNVIRRTPSSGDGGVDVCIPVEGGFDVHQIKRFAFRIGANERRQIRESWGALLADSRLSEPVVAYHLVLPVDPTSDEQRWFEELTYGAPFPCDWRGAVYWDSMAAKYPYVVDYYLRDGRARVEARADALLSMFRAEQPLRPPDVVASLDLLRTAVNREHPHYVFDFVTSDRPPEAEQVPDEVLMAHSQTVKGGGWITVHVRARHAHAQADAPIGGAFTVVLNPRDDPLGVREAMEDFLTFGTGVRLPPGTIESLSIQAPAGLGGEFDGGAVWIGPALIRDPPPRWRLAVVGADDVEVAEVVAITRSGTRGPRGGIELIAEDAGDAFEMIVRVPPPSEVSAGVHFNIRMLNATNKPVMDVLPGIKLLAALLPPNRFEWREEHGLGVLGSFSFQSESQIVEPPYLRLLEHLAVLQANVRGTVRIPAAISDEQAEALAEAVYLLRHREFRGTWTDMRLHLETGVTRDDMAARMRTAAGGDIGSLLIESNAIVQLDTGQFNVGLMHLIFLTARPADVQPDEESSFAIVPGEDASFIRRLGPLSDTS